VRGDFVSVSVIALLVEVPLISNRQQSGPLCVHEAFFEAQSEDDDRPELKTDLFASNGNVCYS
jgi:hypothetical protein